MMDTYPNPDDVHAAHGLAAALTLTFATGITTSLIPPAQPAIITGAVVLGLAWLIIRIIAWRVRERSLDRADALAATTTRTTSETRQHTTAPGAAWSDRGAA